jgi:hypothetical protein
VCKSTSEGQQNRPGMLPCPDLDGDGLEDKPCNSQAKMLGRLPWKTLGMPDPRDAGGESLWYTLAGPFRDWTSNPTTSADAKRINSDTRGNITVLGPDGKKLTDNAVAVIIAPGGALGGQVRSALAAACGYTGTNVLRSLCPNSFLESITKLSSPPTNGPFVTVTAGARNSNFNDQVVYISTADFIPALEMRVGNEIKRALTAYRANSDCQCYPWADTWPYSGGIADIGQNRGRFPTEPFPEQWGDPDPNNVALLKIPYLPPWIEVNDWHNLIWYSVSKRASNNTAQTCRTCSSNDVLSIDGIATAALFFTPGTPPDGIARLKPPSGQSSRIDNLALYLADQQNNDGDDTPSCRNVGEIGGDAGSGMLTGSASCDTYVTPTRKNKDRNRVYLLGATTAGVCQTAAQTILDNKPCGDGFQGNTVNPMCTQAKINLDACTLTCYQAAQVMVKPPCRNTSNPGQCQDAIATLKTCSG